MRLRHALPTVASLQVFAALVVLTAMPPAEADSWMPPGPTLASSEDGRWYVVVEPAKNFRDATFRLVERAKDKPPRRLDDGPHRRGAQPAPSVALEEGDRLVASGPCLMPMEVRCLNDGKGFVLFETYGSIGTGRVVDVHDGAGSLRFSRTLPEILSAKRRETLMRTVSSVWWYAGWWVDEPAQELVFLWKGKGAGGVIRMRLKDGVSRDGAKTDLLARLGRGSAEERIAALKQAADWDVPGTLGAVAAAFDDPTTPALARLHFARFLHDRGDERGTPLFVALARAEDLEARAYAIRHLGTLIGKDALPYLKEAMRAPERALQDSAEFALRHLGPVAVRTLIEMVGDAEAPASYRAGAATALWNMDVQHTLPAEEVLRKASTSPLERLAYAAGHALKQIEAYKAKGAGK